MLVKKNISPIFSLGLILLFCHLMIIPPSAQAFDLSDLNYSPLKSYDASNSNSAVTIEGIYAINFDGITYRVYDSDSNLTIRSNQPSDSITFSDGLLLISLNDTISSKTQGDILSIYNQASDLIKNSVEILILNEATPLNSTITNEAFSGLFIPLKDVPKGNSSTDDTYSPIGPNHREYWKTTNEAVAQLDALLAERNESVPDSSYIIPMDSVPGAPTEVKIFSLSTRGGLYGNDMSASLNMGGDVNTPKKVMFRVKGPSMNFSGAKLANPWMDVYKRSNAQGSSWSEFFKSYDFGDHASKDNYASRATGNDVEPMVVESITPSIVSCVVSSESTGLTGNAIVEIYSLGEDNSTSYFKSLSTRGYVSESDMSGSVTLVGNGTKDIMFRVKGPSMNFSGDKLADPNLAIYHKENGWAEMVKSSTFQQYETQNSSYTNVTENYTDRHTGNNLEPLVVYKLSSGTYSCIISSDDTGGTGSAILEIYDVSE